MNRQLFAAVSVAGFTMGFFATLAVAQGPAVQKPAPKASSIKPSGIPRTADGKPDLSGVFSNAQTIPIQRPANLGDKEFYTAEELAANAARQRRVAEVGVHYDTSQFGLGAGQAKYASTLRTSVITGTEGRLPALTPEATKIQAQRREVTQEHQWDSAENRPLAERCITWGFEGPPMMPVGYNSDLQIVQGIGTVAIIQEMIHDTRVIPTDGRPFSGSNVPQWMGESRGHWDGDTLVVETKNFTTRTAIQGTPTSDTLKVTERFSRLDADTVLYNFTVDDPKTWVKPWSGEYTMTKIDSPLYEYACHEGNHGIANNLSGARAQEKAAAAKKQAGSN
jgi:hypothetical protein